MPCVGTGDVCLNTFIPSSLVFLLIESALPVVQMQKDFYFCFSRVLPCLGLVSRLRSPGGGRAAGRKGYVIQASNRLEWNVQLTIRSEPRTDAIELTSARGESGFGWSGARLHPYEIRGNQGNTLEICANPRELRSRLAFAFPVSDTAQAVSTSIKRDVKRNTPPATRLLSRYPATAC